MRWPWRHSPEPEEPMKTSAPQRSRTREEATKARRRAEADLAATRAQTPIYRAIGEQMRRVREENHFAERIAASLRGD